MPGPTASDTSQAINGIMNGDSQRDVTECEENDEDDGQDIFTPEFRLVNRDDPEAYAFNTPRYSAHKMPKDVVDASGGGEAGLREFMGRWREIMREQERDDGADGSR